MTPQFRWIVLVWRLPNGSSTPRVTVWRRLRRMGAMPLTPGAAIVPYSEALLEQLDWIAEGVADEGGDAWVLPVGRLSEAEEKKVIAQSLADRAEEYSELEAAAREIRGSGTELERLRQALDRRLRKVIARDHFVAPERAATAEAVARVLQG